MRRTPINATTVAFGLICLGLGSPASSQTLKTTPSESGDSYFNLRAPSAPSRPSTLSGTDTLKPESAELKTLPKRVAQFPDTSKASRGLFDPLKPLATSAADAPQPAASPAPKTSAPKTSASNILNRAVPAPTPSALSNVPASEPTQANAPRSNSGAVAPQEPAPQPGNFVLSHESPPFDSVAASATDAPPLGSSRASEASDEVFEPGRVLAIVGGRPILVGDMLQEINELIATHAQKEPEERKQATRQLLVQRMLPKFVDRQLIYVDSIRGLPEGADIEKINSSLGKAFDDEALSKLVEKSGAPSALEFDAQLRLMGSSLRQYRQSWIDDQFVKYSLGQKMQSDEEEVAYQEIRDYYDKHIDEFRIPARAKWEQLVVRFDRAPDRESARRMIAEMGNEVVYGASLDAVAKKSSHDRNAKDGGQQDWINQGSLANEALDRAIFELPLNQLSDVIETPSGLHIIRVLERMPAGAKPFRDAQVEIKEKLALAKREKRFEEYLAKLRREIPIEVVDQSIKLPEQYILR